MQENSDLKKDNKKVDDYEIINKTCKNAYAELTTVLAHYAMFLQRVSVIITINILELGILGTLIGIIGISKLIIYFLVIFVISLIINICILLPNFSNSNEKDGAKYFYNYYKFEIPNKLNELKEYIDLDDNTIKQILTNSKVLRKKYRSFRYSITLTFCFFPLLIFLWFYIVKLENKYENKLKIKSTWKRFKNKFKKTKNV